jgi:Uma2 family endonuclease
LLAFRSHRSRPLALLARFAGIRRRAPASACLFSSASRSVPLCARIGPVSNLSAGAQAMSVQIEHPSSAGLGPPAVPTEPIWRLSVEDYHTMLRTGVLQDGDPVELLEGWLVAKMTKHPPHTTSTQLLRDLLARLLPTGYYVNDQEPITTGDSEPEPDVSVIRGERRQYLQRHPGPRDVALLVEVADTTLARDRGIKKRIYARAGIANYWILNLTERKLEVYTGPSGPAQSPDYAQQQDYGPSDEVRLFLDGREIARLPVRELLP